MGIPRAIYVHKQARWEQQGSERAFYGSSPPSHSPRGGVSGSFSTLPTYIRVVTAYAGFVSRLLSLCLPRTVILVWDPLSRIGPWGVCVCVVWRHREMCVCVCCVCVYMSKVTKSGKARQGKTTVWHVREGSQKAARLEIQKEKKKQFK